MFRAKSTEDTIKKKFSFRFLHGVSDIIIHMIDSSMNSDNERNVFFFSFAKIKKFFENARLVRDTTIVDTQL